MENKNRNTPMVAVDAVVIGEDKSVLLVKRSNPPFKDYWSLPGGFVEYGETAEEAVKREVREETGLEIKPIKLIGVYSDPKRDPRGHVISIAFLAKVVGGKVTVSPETREIRRFRVLPAKIAFDHLLIIKDALKLHKKKK